MSGREFILANTSIAAPSMLPEIRLHLATEITPIWRATEESLNAQGVEPPYWAFAWPGGQAVSRYVLDHGALFVGKHVMDFAAGSGVAAIATALRGAASVTAGDIDALACQAMAMNAALNHVSLVTDKRDWLALPLPDPVPDFVLAGDVCYEKPLAEQAFGWLRAMAQKGATVLMGDPGRHYLPTQGLRETARYDIPTSLQLENSGLKQTVLWQVIG